MIYTILKSTYAKLEPNILRNVVIKISIKNLSSKTYDMGWITLVSLMNLMTNSKQYGIITHLFKLRGNTKPNVNKTLRKEIMQDLDLKIKLINQVKKKIKAL